MFFNTQLEEELYNLGIWNSEVFKYHINSKNNKIKHKKVKYGQVWYCNLGSNIGEEKNKNRPILVVSNNEINKTGKFIGVCITDAKGKVDINGFTNKNTWALIYSNTHLQENKYHPNRVIPQNALQYYFLDKDSVVQCEEIRSLSKVRLDTYIGRLHINDMERIKLKLKITFKIF